MPGKVTYTVLESDMRTKLKKLSQLVGLNGVSGALRYLAYKYVDHEIALGLSEKKYHR